MPFKMALRSIGANKMRALLTMLGIIIGVMALVVLVSLVNGATTSVTDRMASLGSNYVQAYIWGGGGSGGEGVTIDELEEWVESEPLIESVAPQSASNAMAKFGSKSQNMTVCGTTPSYYEINGLKLTAGRFLKTADLQNNSRVCVLGPSTADTLVGYTDCVGEEISLDGMKYVIVGVLSEEENLMTSLNISTLTAYIPYTSLMRLSSSVTADVTSFVLSAADGATVAQAETAIKEILTERFQEDEDAYSVRSMNVMEDAMSSITSVLSILLGGIAGISLIVGGIGIMNIMLVTVTERTREIGIRKAIGASRGTILRQFLMEAVVLCMIGCAIGIFLSWSILRIAAVVASSLSMRFALNGTVVFIAVVFCFAIGVIFGLYPANKAAKMKPIDALHYGG